MYQVFRRRVIRWMSAAAVAMIFATMIPQTAAAEAPPHQDSYPEDRGGGRRRCHKPAIDVPQPSVQCGW
jgi:hypothetical protein